MFGIDENIILLLAAGMAFAAILLFMHGFVPEDLNEEQVFGYREKKRQRLIESDRVYALSLPVVKVFAHYIRMIPDNKFNMGERRALIADKLKRSGFMGAYTPNEFYGLTCTMAVAGFLGMLLLTVMITDTPNFFVGFIGAGVAACVPTVTLNNTIENRLTEIDRQLPYSVDLLVLSMRAGLDFITALDRVVTRGQETDPDNPMTQEWGVVLQEMRVGTARSDALLNLVMRVQSDYLKSMVGAIIQAEKRGTPLSQVLEVQVGTIRTKRTQLIEKKAAQAAVKILFPLMFIFGSVVVVILGAVVYKMYRSGGI